MQERTILQGWKSKDERNHRENAETATKIRGGIKTEGIRTRGLGMLALVAGKGRFNVIWAI